MLRQDERIQRLLQRVRSRRRGVEWLRAITRAALGVSLVVGVAIVAARALTLLSVGALRTPVTIVTAGVATLGAAIAVLCWNLRPLAARPSDRRIARLIEERVPSLEDRLATAVDLCEESRVGDVPVLAEPLVADAARRAASVDIDAVVSSALVRRVAVRAAGAVGVLVAIATIAWGPARQTVDAASLALFPERVRLEIAPGDARLRAGAPLTIAARVLGNRAPVVPRLQVPDGNGWRSIDMMPRADGAFAWVQPSVSSDFKYRVAVAAVTSPVYAVTVARPPRIVRIDVDYAYPPSLGLRRRTDEDGGDVYAPAGTQIRLHVRTDRAAASARLAFARGETLALDPEPATRPAAAPSLTGTFTVGADDAYRITIADAEGLTNGGDSEYFVRVLQDRPPDVHIVRPAADRPVARLDEVDIEAEADDDYGLAAVELVYAVRGGREQVVPLAFTPRATIAAVKHAVFLEDLDVQPGDFVAYYVRARDVTQGRRSNEARSDIFFLEVKPFEQEFTLAQSQSMAGSGYNGSIEELVNAQKQVVVATWKLDRRAQTSGARSDQDVRAVGRTEAELKVRVEETASSLRESTLRDPRRRLQGGGPAAASPMPEEDAMTAAASAMAKAVVSLNALKTDTALPAEMEALNELLKAQAQVKRRQVARQQSGPGGPGNNNRNYDITTLFDRELQRAQQTSYETGTPANQRANQSALDRIRDLARRQDELLKRQQEMAQRPLPEAEQKRQLETLTRAQTELRQHLDDIERQLSNQRGEAGRSGQGGRGGEGSQDIRSAQEQMRGAASDLRRQDPAQASARAGKALDALRRLEQQMQAGAGAMSGARRALGDMQLDARELADAQRDIAAELSKLPSASKADGARRLAGEQERLADRLRQLQKRLQEMAADSTAAAGENQAERRDAQGVAARAARELGRQRLPERMQQAADALRGQSGDRSASLDKQAAAQQDLARELDKLGEQLAAKPADSEAQRLSGQLEQARRLRARINEITQQLEALGRQNRDGGRAPSDQKVAGETGRTGEGRQAGAGGNTDLNRLRDEYTRQLQQARDLLADLRRDDASISRGAGGFTLEGQGMTLSAPGTEAFKQDFSRWNELRRQATQALDAAESSLSRRLQQRESKERLAAGIDDPVAPEYRKPVADYFKAIAGRSR